jgi:hypothetical protein
MNPGGSTSRGFTLWHLWLLLPHRQRYARPAQRGFAKALLRGVLGLFQGRSEPCVGMQGTVQPHCPPRLSFPGGCLHTVHNCPPHFLIPHNFFCCFWDQNRPHPVTGTMLLLKAALSGISGGFGERDTSSGQWGAWERCVATRVWRRSAACSLHARPVSVLMLWNLRADKGGIERVVGFQVLGVLSGHGRRLSQWWRGLATR